jgi:hypothetical protein
MKAAICTVAVLYLSLTLTGSAQTATVAGLAYIEGVVYLDEQVVPGLSGPKPLETDAVIRTGQGRAAVALRRGGTLLLSEESSARVIRNGVYNFNRIEVISGSAVVISSESSPEVICRGLARLSSSGIFRLDVQPPDRNGYPSCRIRIYEGAAATQATTLLNALRPGQSTMLPSGDMIPILDFSPTDLDEFDRWSRQHATTPSR